MHQSSLDKAQHQAEVDSLRREAHALARKVAFHNVVPAAAIAAATSAFGGDSHAMGNDYASVLENPGIQEKLYGFAWSNVGGPALIEAEEENKQLVADTKYLTRKVCSIKRRDVRLISVALARQSRSEE